MDILKLRWERINNSNISFDLFKLIIKNKFNYEVAEASINDFRMNIDKYSEINEGDLLAALEDISYDKLSIFSIEETIAGKLHPILESFNSLMGIEIFKTQNRIINNNSFHQSEHDTGIYKVYRYEDDDQGEIINLTLYALKECPISNIGDFGSEENNSTIVYDCVKFIVNTKQHLVLMLYSDIDISISKSRDNIFRKLGFLNLFLVGTEPKNVNTYLNKYFTKYDLKIYLNKYILSYLEDVLNNNKRKLISTIKTSLVGRGKSSLESISATYDHRKARLLAIKDEIEDGTHVISTIECNFNSNSIKLRNNGELSLYNQTFSKEVIEDVCNEFFEGKKLL